MGNIFIEKKLYLFYMYHCHNFGQSLKLSGGPTVRRRVERGVQIGGKGFIAFRVE